MLDALKTRLQPWLAERLNALDLAVQVFEPLNGGSIQENWRLRCALSDGAERELVLRKDSPAKIASSRTRREEYAIMEVAHKAGVLTPEPIGSCDDAGVIGAPFAVMAMVEGVGLGPRIARTCRWAETEQNLRNVLVRNWPKSTPCGRRRNHSPSWGNRPAIRRLLR